jgi:hypothetical protein
MNGFRWTQIHIHVRGPRTRPEIKNLRRANQHQNLRLTYASSSTVTMTEERLIAGPAAPALPEEQEPEDDVTLLDILASSNPSIPLNDPETQKYLSHLTTLSLTTLLAEPTVLRTQSHHLTSSLTALTQGSYPTFLSLHKASASLSSSLSSLSSSLDSLLQDSLPKLDECVAGWNDRTDGVLRERKKARVVLEQHDKIRDILDIPLLIDTCVRNGYFAEALSLASHASAISSSLSSLSNFQSTAILQSVCAEVHHSTTQMLLTLLSTLHEPNRKLPALWKAVNFLRKMEVFDDEDQIAIAFLSGREACLKASLDSCGKDVQALIFAANGEGGGTQLGEREREDIAKYLRRYIDLWREGVYDIITQYTSIFLDRSSSTIPSPKSSTSSLYPTLHTLLTTYASHALSTHLLPPLKSLLPLVPAAHSSLLTQLTYCATAFARVGMDFRGLLEGLFCDAVQKSVSRELRDVGVWWAGRVRAATKNPGKAGGSLPPSQWLVTPGQASAPPTTTNPAASSPVSAPAHMPPPILASYPPVAEFTNKVLGTLNALRMLAPVGIMDELLSALEAVLADGLTSLLRYARSFSWKRARANAGDGVGDGEREERVMRAAGDVYVKIFVPYMRRALVEGVYGVEMSMDAALAGGESQTELGKAIREWEGWLTSDPTEIP